MQHHFHRIGYVLKLSHLSVHSSRAPGVCSHQEQILLKSEQRNQPENIHSNLSSLENNWMKTAGVPTNYLEQIQCEESPHRTGQPECSYFMITGYYKYTSSSRYHHPKDISSKFPVCTLNSKGPAS